MSTTAHTQHASSMSASSPTAASAGATNSSKKRQNPIQLCDLPEELLVRIALPLPDGDLARLARTSKLMYRICWCRWIWHQRFVYRFSQAFLLSKTTPPRPETTIDPSSSSSPSILNNDANEDEVGAVGWDELSIHSTSTLEQNSADDDDDQEEEEEDHSAVNADNNATDNASGERGRTNKGKAQERSKSPPIVFGRTVDVPLETLLDLYQRYSRMVIPAEDMAICHMGDRYWVMEETGQSRFGKVAALRSVWWLDVWAVFYGVPQGRYRLRWRMKVTSNGPIVGTKFIVKLSKTSELDMSKAASGPAVITFVPRDMEHFKEHTNAESSTIRRSIKKLIPGFTIFEVPGVIDVDDTFSNVLVQIQNHDGWKSGMHLDYVQLVREEDVAKVDQEQASEAVRLEAHNEEINDEGEEYYPRIWPLYRPFGGTRSNTYRRFSPPGFVDDDSPIQPSSPNSPSTTATVTTSTTASSSSTTGPRQQQQRLAQHPRNQDGQADDIWYRVLPLLLLYSIFVYFTG